jgi:hypothetical protein
MPSRPRSGRYSRGSVVLRAADGAEQHRIGLARQLPGRLGIGLARRIHRAASEQGRLHLQLDAVRAQRFEHAHGLADDFGADAIARQYTNFHSIPFFSGNPRRTAPS